MPTVNGVDISHHQGGKLHMAEGRREGVQFVYHKATEGATWKDPNYAQRRVETARAGLVFGAYHYAHPERGDAEQEARHFLSVAKPRVGDLLPALDLEENHGLTQAELTAWVGTFISVVQKWCGAKPIIYTSYTLDKNFGCILWQPRYNNKNIPPSAPSPWKRVDIWQFSDGVFGRPNQIAGFGKVDLNTFMHAGVRLEDIRIPKKKEEADASFFKITTQNVQSLPLMHTNKVREDVELTAKQSGVIGWQEIKPERYDDVVHELEAQGDWETYWGQGNAIPGFKEPADNKEKAGFNSPVSWRVKHWDFVEGGQWLLHEKSRFTGDRYLCWVLLKHKKTKARVMFASMHFIPGAFNKRASRNDLRQKIWIQDFKRMRTWVGNWMQMHPDAAVCLMADWNATEKHMNAALKWRHRWMGKRRVLRTHQKAIDHIFLINGKSCKWKVLSQHTLAGRNSDHQGRCARVQLTRRK